MLTVFLDFAMQLATPSGLYELALRLAQDYDRPAVYDMPYVALAQIAGCDLWTADRRLINALNGRLPFVKDLRTYDV
jgi:predicted nucleic acid-binding protein